MLVSFLQSSQRVAAPETNDLSSWSIVIYTLQLPETLASTFRGKAMKFGYELSLALNLNFGGDRQKTHELSMPIKVFPTIDGEFQGKEFRSRCDELKWKYDNDQSLAGQDCMTS